MWRTLRVILSTEKSGALRTIPAQLGETLQIERIEGVCMYVERG